MRKLLSGTMRLIVRGPSDAFGVPDAARTLALHVGRGVLTENNDRLVIFARKLQSG